MYHNLFLRAKGLQTELDAYSAASLPPKQDPFEGLSTSFDLFNQFVTDKALKVTVEKLFRDGHHARAVEEAYKFVDNLVKKTANPADASLTGSKLMTTVFSTNAPLLRMNAGKSTSERDEQLGYMQIFSGCMTGIRNPRAHECDWEDSEHRALQLLIWANHLVERIRMSERVPEKQTSKT